MTLPGTRTVSTSVLSTLIIIVILRYVYSSGPAVAALPVTVKRYLCELKQVLNRDNARARRILATLIGEIILRRHGDRLVAELRGNLQGILDLSCDSSGAGRGI